MHIHQIIKTALFLFCFLMAPYVAFCFNPEAEMVWSEEDGDKSHILYSSFQDGSWQNPEILVEDDALNILPALGTNSKNQQLLVWVVVKNSGLTELRYQFRKNSFWGKPHQIPTSFQTNLAPVILCDHKDVFWLFWAANSGGDDDIFMSNWRKGKWSRPIQVNIDNSVPDILPDAWIDDAHGIWVSWQQMDGQGNYQQVEQMLTTDGQQKNMLNHQKRYSAPRKKVETFNNQLALPFFLDTKGRSTIHFRNNRSHPSQTIRGKE